VSAGAAPTCSRSVADPLEIRPSLHVLSCRILSFYVKGTSIIKEIRLKIWFLASRLSRSLKVIGTNMDRSAAYDFPLTFHSNHGPISCRFRDKLRFRLKIEKNSRNTRVFCAPAEVVPLGTGYRRWWCRIKPFLPESYHAHWIHWAVFH